MVDKAIASASTSSSVPKARRSVRAATKRAHLPAPTPSRSAVQGGSRYRCCSRGLIDIIRLLTRKALSYDTRHVHRLGAATSVVFAPLVERARRRALGTSIRGRRNASDMTLEDLSRGAAGASGCRHGSSEPPSTLDRPAFIVPIGPRPHPRARVGPNSPPISGNAVACRRTPTAFSRAVPRLA